MPNMLTEGNPKKEFMNTIVLEGARQHRKNNGETRKFADGVAWMDAKKCNEPYLKISYIVDFFFVIFNNEQQFETQQIIK